MAIRFCCPSCKKPLEVDSVLAGKDVLCFYCHTKAAVPTESDPSLGTPTPEDHTPAAPAVPGKPPLVGYIGLVASLVLVACFSFFIIWGMGKLMPMLRTPEFAKLSQKQQIRAINEKVLEIRKSPAIFYGSHFFVAMDLLALGFSIAGVVTNRGRTAAIFGLVISGLITLLLLYQLLHAVMGRGSP